MLPGRLTVVANEIVTRRNEKLFDVDHKGELSGDALIGSYRVVANAKGSPKAAAAW